MIIYYIINLGYEINNNLYIINLRYLYILIMNKHRLTPSILLCYQMEYYFNFHVWGIKIILISVESFYIFHIFYVKLHNLI